MAAVALIIIARALHVVSSVVWAGFVMIAGFVLVRTPKDMRPEDARRIRQSAVSRAARIVAPAAIVSLVSGLYLFSALHAGVRTPTEMALGVGAASAVLSFFVGPLGSGGPERELARLDAQRALSAAETAKIRRLNARVVISARVTAYLLLISGVAMAVARFL